MIYCNLDKNSKINYYSLFLYFRDIQYFNSKDYSMSTTEYMKTSCFKFTRHTGIKDYDV